MKYLLQALCLLYLNNVSAQSCPDTVRVKGYYITAISEDVLKPPEIKKNGNREVRTYVIDRLTPCIFLPLDSITSSRSLADWLLKFNQRGDIGAYAADMVYAKLYLAERGCKINVDTIDFPRFVYSDSYYKPIGGIYDVYSISFVDADWIKFTMHKDSLFGELGIDEYSRYSIPKYKKQYPLHVMYHLRRLDRNPEINDPRIQVIEKRKRNK